MTKKLEAYYAARRRRDEVERYLSLRGKQSNATARHVGTLHYVTVKTTIHFQPTDGAANYHECPAFDEALAIVIRNNFGELVDGVRRSVRTKVAQCAEEAQDELNALHDEFRSALRDKEG